MVIFTKFMKKIKIFPTNEETSVLEETAVLRNKDFLYICVYDRAPSSVSFSVVF